MEINEITTTPHALERFQERYEALSGIRLNGDELTAKLRELIDEAVPEEESPALETRRQTHGGIGTYLINPPWRFVFSEKGLETCEIAPQETLFVKNPRIPLYSEKARFSINIKPNRRKRTTKIIRSVDKKTLHLKNLIEIEVIIRALRALGLEVNRMAEPRRLEIVIPQNINVYLIEGFAKPENVRITTGRTDCFLLGRQRVNCSGILKPDLEKILDFLQVNKSQKAVLL